jgi:hypothetical protein
MGARGEGLWVWGWIHWKKKIGVFLCPFFCHMVFTDGFLISLKELGLLNNKSQQIMGLDFARYYIYCILNNEENELTIRGATLNRLASFPGLGF